MPEPLTKCTACETHYPHRELRCPQCRNVGVPYLYKYRSLNDYARQNLLDRTLWFPSVAFLNDPFEFAFALKEMHVFGVPIDGFSLTEAREAMKQYGVLSMSEICDSILMWTHYSAAHTGFCMQFERTDGNDLGSYDKCFPVIYDDEYPTFLPQQLQDRSIVAKVITTKARQWSYEREWRMLAHSGQRAYPFPGELRGIVFGCRMPSASRREVAAILHETVDYSEAVVSETRFAVEIRPLSPSSLL